MRLNRYLALRGVATRRGADELIRSGQVTLNGKQAALGDKVMSEDDLVEVYSGDYRPEETYSYAAYYKPRGIVTHSPAPGQRSIEQVSSYPNLFPIGRLDRDSEGLIILTDDGRVTERLLHPRFEHEKEYLVAVREKTQPGLKQKLEQGVESEGETLSAKKVTIDGPYALTIILTQGKKHQIRRMLEASGLTVERLVRVRVMNVHLGSLKPGEGRFLEGKAKKKFLQDLGLKS